MNLRNRRNSLSSEIGNFMKAGQKEEAEKIKEEVKAINEELEENKKLEEEYALEVKKRMMVIPNIIDDSVPIGEDDSKNVEIEKFGEPVVPDYEIPYHADILESINGLDKESAGRTSGNGILLFNGRCCKISKCND